MGIETLAMVAISAAIVYYIITYEKPASEHKSDVAFLAYSDNNSLGNVLDLLLKGPKTAVVRYYQFFPGQYEMDTGDGVIFQIDDTVLSTLASSANVILQRVPGPINKS